MNVFDEDFNIQEYVQRRALEIEDLSSRRIYKELAAKIFVDLHGEIEKEYKGLEKRVLGEVPMPLQGPEIITNIIDKKRYDATDSLLLPMRPEDLQERKVDSEALMDSLQKKEPFFLYTVFLQADYREVLRLKNSSRSFRGVIQAEHSEYTAIFTTRPNTFYRKKIEELYTIFQINYMPWRSVCAPYLFKLFDVYITGIENWDPKETVREVAIDFEEYKEVIGYHQIPLWNARTVSIKTSTYPEPCVDKINYEHRIFQHKLKDGAKYLITNQDIKVSNVRSVNGDLIVTCPVQDPVEWELYQFSETGDGQYPNASMRNGQEPTFAAKLRHHFATRIKTKQEVARLLATLYCAGLLEFVDVRPCPNFSPKESYCVDYFIADELRIGNAQTALLLDFKPRYPDYFVNRDIMSFMVGIVQRYFPEYECCGRLV